MEKYDCLLLGREKLQLQKKRQERSINNQMSLFYPSIGPAKDRNFPTSARLDIRAKGWRPRDTCGFLWRQLELTDHWLETAAGRY